MAIKFTKEQIIGYIDAELKTREDELNAEADAREAEVKKRNDHRDARFNEIAARLRSIDFDKLTDEELVGTFQGNHYFVSPREEFDRAAYIKKREPWAGRNNNNNKNLTNDHLRRAKKIVGDLIEDSLSMTDLRDLGLKGLIP